jgi:hypothetical protein
MENDIKSRDFSRPRRRPRRIGAFDRGFRSGLSIGTFDRGHRIDSGAAHKSPAASSDGNYWLLQLAKYEGLVNPGSRLRSSRELISSPYYSSPADGRSGLLAISRAH